MAFVWVNPSKFARTPAAFAPALQRAAAAYRNVHGRAPVLVPLAHGLTGLGIGPTDPCYDPTRPAWLPTWISTPSESGCLWGFYPSVNTLAPIPAPPAQSAPAAPQTVAQMTVPGAFTPDTSEAATSAQSQSDAQAFFDSLAASGNFGPTSTVQCNPGAQSWMDTSTWCPDRWMEVAIGGALAVVAIAYLFGGRR